MNILLISMTRTVEVSNDMYLLTNQLSRDVLRSRNPERLSELASFPRVVPTLFRGNSRAVSTKTRETRTVGGFHPRVKVFETCGVDPRRRPPDGPGPVGTRALLKKTSLTLVARKGRHQMRPQG